MRLFKSIVCGILLIIAFFALVAGFLLFPAPVALTILVAMLVGVASNFFYEVVFNET